jgi:hypothetical protein
LGPLSRTWLAAAVLACCAAVAVILVARGGETSGVGPRAPLTVHASLDHEAVEFGDPVAASVTVLADRGTVDVSRLRVQEDLAPLTQLGPMRVTRTTRGRLVVLTYSARASCLDQRCIAGGRSKRIVLPPVRVAGTGRPVRASWPTLQVRSRVLAADVAQPHPPLRSDPTPPPVTYRVAPGELALVLGIAAALLAIGAVLLAGWTATVLIRSRLSRARPLTGLDRALALAREAERRPPPDRRRALGLLARLLGTRNRRLADAAEKLAWSASAPPPTALAELVAQVEREVNGA